jgi:hypothetical protein
MIGNECTFLDDCLQFRLIRIAFCTDETLDLVRFFMTADSNTGCVEPSLADIALNVEQVWIQGTKTHALAVPLLDWGKDFLFQVIVLRSMGIQIKITTTAIMKN